MSDKKKSTQYSLFFIQRFKGKVLFNVPMSEYTSLRIGGPADVMAFPQDDADLKNLITFAEDKGFPYQILGNGTNLLVRDGGIRGVVINMCEGFKEIIWQDDMRAVAGAGATLASLLNGSRDRGASGLEFAVNIPGTVGGAVVMNAGAYGVEIKDVCEAIELIGRKGKPALVKKEDAGFAYRKSDLPKGAVVVRAHLKFERNTVEEIRKKIDEYRAKRRAAAAIHMPNAGSIFINPEGHIAGRLIEEAGLKGERIGGAEVSEAHGNYIVNRGNARAKDVLALMALIRDRIYGTRGIVLEPEIKVIGED
ncbi:MAG: UDP-N-acetylmuramate dehydrogenase [Deltaproteobacteria bacterium]|nr:UDP-N-acetylmuramate dehydrogenase [Deltaproteobacteria bacterium]